MCQILRLKRTEFDSPDPAEGTFSAPPDPLAGFKGPTSKGREGEWRGEGNGEGREDEVRGEGRRGGGEDGLQHWTPSGRPNPATPLFPCDSMAFLFNVYVT